MRTSWVRASVVACLMWSGVTGRAWGADEEAGAPGKAWKIEGGREHVYKQVEGRGLRLVVLPAAGAKEGEARPAIVLFHGGGWVGGSPDKLAPQAKYLASRGVVAVLVEYRLLKRKGEEPPTVCIQDAKSAMRWVRAHAGELGIDPKRIGAGGGSAGGHLAAAVSLLPGLDDPQDDLSVSPRADALVLWNPVFDNGPGEYGNGRVKEQYKTYSPAHNVGPGAPPTIVLQGDRDRLIPAVTVERFKAAMEKARARCDVVIYPGQGHGFFNKGAATGDGEYYVKSLRAADEFLASLGWVEGKPTLKEPGTADR